MKKWVALLSLLFVVSLSADAYAWRLPRLRNLVRRPFISRRAGVKSSHGRFTGGPQAVAEQKARIMAQRGLRGHIGGGFGGGNAEGTGRGRTRQQALNNCCFTGTRTCIGAACYQNPRTGTWHAVKIYR